MALYNYLSIINNYNAIDYMRETMLLSGCLLLLILILYLISTHYIKNNVINEKLIFLPLEKVEIDEKNLKKNLSSNNKSKNNNTRYILIEKKELLNKVPARTRCGAESLVIKNSSQVGLKKLWNMNIQSAENFKGFSETIRQYDNLENNTNTLLKVKNSLNEKYRNCMLSVKNIEMLGAEGVIISQEGFGNPTTDLMVVCQSLEKRNIKTVIITNEDAGIDGMSESLPDSVTEAKAIISTGNSNATIMLPKMERVIGHLKDIEKTTGGNVDSIQEDGRLLVEIHGIMGSHNLQGNTYLSATTI